LSFVNYPEGTLPPLRDYILDFDLRDEEQLDIVYRNMEKFKSQSPLKDYSPDTSVMIVWIE